MICQYENCTRQDIYMIRLCYGHALTVYAFPENHKKSKYKPDRTLQEALNAFCHPKPLKKEL